MDGGLTDGPVFLLQGFHPQLVGVQLAFQDPVLLLQALDSLLQLLPRNHRARGHHVGAPGRPRGGGCGHNRISRTRVAQFGFIFGADVHHDATRVRWRSPGWSSGWSTGPFHAPGQFGSMIASGLDWKSTLCKNPTPFLVWFRRFNLVSCTAPAPIENSQIFSFKKRQLTTSKTPAWIFWTVSRSPKFCSVQDLFTINIIFIPTYFVCPILYTFT